MADPLSIVGLAASIVQFLDFGFRLIKCAKEVLQSAEGVRKEISQLRRATEDIKNQALAATSTAQQQSKDEKAIRDLANQCIPLSDTLIKKLESLQIREDAWSRTLEAIRISAETLFKRKDIRELAEKLKSIDEDLRSRIVQVMQK